MPTPFGIRRRLKSLFGMESVPTSVPDIPMVSVTVVGPTGTEETVQAFIGATLVGAGSKMKRPIATGCSETNCGTCRVEVLEGADCLTEQTAKERATLKENNFSTDYRLACCTELVKGAVKVRAFEVM
jgi:ferredoxin